MKWKLTIETCPSGTFRANGLGIPSISGSLSIFLFSLLHYLKAKRIKSFQVMAPSSSFHFYSCP